MAFAISSAQPVEDRYLDQIKILTNMVLAEIFRIDGDLMPEEQPFTIEEAIVAFVAAQHHKWNESNRTFTSRLSGSAGGNDDWAKEALAFGLHVENSYWGGASNLESPVARYEIDKTQLPELSGGALMPDSSGDAP